MKRKIGIQLCESADERMIVRIVWEDSPKDLTCADFGSVGTGQVETGGYIGQACA